MRGIKRSPELARFLVASLLLVAMPFALVPSSKTKRRFLFLFPLRSDVILDGPKDGRHRTSGGTFGCPFCYPC